MIRCADIIVVEMLLQLNKSGGLNSLGGGQFVLVATGQVTRLLKHVCSVHVGFKKLLFTCKHAHERKSHRNRCASLFPTPH